MIVTISHLKRQVERLNIEIGKPTYHEDEHVPEKERIYTKGQYALKRHNGHLFSVAVIKDSAGNYNTIDGLRLRNKKGLYNELIEI